MLTHHRDGLLGSSFLAWSSIAQSVCGWAFSLLSNRCFETSRFESCIQQKKTICLFPIRISLACATASKFNNNRHSCCRWHHHASSYWFLVNILSVFQYNSWHYCVCVLCVCFIIKSFLTYSIFRLYLLYQPYLGLCQAAVARTSAAIILTL